jgi:hypothetical protein
MQILSNLLKKSRSHCQYAKTLRSAVIEAVNKEDGPIKRIRKLLDGGC